MKTATVGKGAYQGRTNAAIQKAVDDVAAGGGGVVTVPKGVYQMRDALHLRSGVRVVGQAGTVLRKAPSAASEIPAFLGYGHYELVVAEPEKFPPGTGVHILDTGAGGFYTTVATVLAREGDKLYINRMLNHDYHQRNKARAVSVFPLVEGEGIHDAAVENVTLDGQADKQSMTLNGCRGGGVFLILSRRVAVRGVEVTGYRGDAISFQQCTDILVEKCHLHDNTGTGLHPGSGSVRYILQYSRSVGNGGCGIYYCLRTTHSICRRNEFARNGREGISIGERDTDHRIEGNRVAGNAGGGVLWRGFTYEGGDRVQLIGNEIGPNGAGKNRGEISLPGGLRDVCIQRNRLSGVAPVVRVAGAGHNVSIAANKVDGRAQQAGDIQAPARAVRRTVPKTLPKIDPSALPRNGARHLGIASLDPWDERRMWPG